ncbi:MAG: hypothetical protein IT175_00130 [Acidobacteria bacterium]|nr:hypothetical protein [Acidobacteriota bacterium]
MRIDLNLSSDPFRNRTVFWLVVSGGYLLVLVTLVIALARAGAVGADTVAFSDEAAKQAESIAGLELRIAEMKAAEGSSQFTDADRRALDEARTLLERKSVSWSRLLGDLEPFVPERAKLTGIEIVGFEGSGSSLVVQLRISGTGRDLDQMTTFLARLDGSGGRFDSDPVENGPLSDNSEFGFVIDVRYRPSIAADETGIASGATGATANG